MGKESLLGLTAKHMMVSLIKALCMVVGLLQKRNRFSKVLLKEAKKVQVSSQPPMANIKDNINLEKCMPKMPHSPGTTVKNMLEDFNSESSTATAV